MARKQNKSSADFVKFCMTVYTASATYLEPSDYMDIYADLLRVLWWNHDIDMQLAIQEEVTSNPNPSGVVMKGKKS